MSDTQGANLEGDMPPMGTAPPTTGIARSPLQLPSPLQGLAKFFTQSQGQPKPAQKPFPPKPPVLTEEQAHQPPQHTGKPASFAPVPATIPVPTGGFTPYMKTADTRDPSQWGDPVRFQRLPATFEVMPMLHQIGQYFAQAGGDVGRYGAETAYHSGAYWDGFTKTQERKMKLAQEGAALSSKLLDESLRRRAFEYRDIWNEYLAAVGGDRHLLATKTIGGMNLYDAMHAKALELGDEPAVRMFENGESLEHILNYFNEHDKIMRDLQAARQKAGDQSADDAAELGSDAGGAGKATPNEFATPTPGGQPADAAAPPKTPDAADTPDWAKGKELAPTMIARSEDRFMGTPRDPAENKDIGRAADRHEKEMEVAANKILDDAHAGRIKPSEVMPAVRKALGPRIADAAEGVANYTRPGYGSGAGGGQTGRSSEYPQFLDALASAADPADPDHNHPGFVATFYKSQQDFRQSNQKQIPLRRMKELPAMADSLNTDITILQNQGYNIKGMNWQGIFDAAKGDPNFARLRQDMLAYAQAYQTVVTGGRATVSGTHDVQESFPSWAPLETYRTVLKGHFQAVLAQTKGFHQEWESIGGKPTNMPTGDPANEKAMRDYWLMDPETGALPYGKVIEHKTKSGRVVRAKWTGKNQIDRMAPENWVSPDSTPD